MRSTRFALLAIFVSLTGHACGDSDSDDDGPMCGGVQSCGGDLEGSWKLNEGCYIVLEQPKLDFCPTATAELHATHVEGSITFQKDSYVRHTEIETELLLKLPAKCQEQEGKDKKSCTSFGATLSNGASLVCADADNKADGCECSATVINTGNDSGGYNIRGNRVEIGDTFDYCVKGKTLTLRPSESIKMSGVAVTSQLQTVFEKN
ncbi:MAG TPA: hypothetical protein VFN67_01015 [Polyangiales bacterium]|nr:hypothetical protein [Polyangiales bacterium]